MKKLLLIIASISVLFFSCSKGGGCDYSLDGTWVRKNDPSGMGLEGMKVQYSGNKGVIAYVNPNNGRGFYVGQWKWQNFNKNTCQMYDLLMPTNTYELYDVVFNSSTEFVVKVGTNGDVTYVKQ